VLKNFDGVVAVSNSIALRLEGSGVDDERIRVLPNAFRERAQPLSGDEARLALGLDGEHLHAGWVGRLSHEKGCDVAISALARLNDPRVVLSIIGDGPQLATLKAHALREGVAARIRWHGALPCAAHLYKAFDVFILSSRTEGTPIALFEAMSAGTPIIATAVGGVPDVVGAREALLVDSESPDALAWGINEIINVDRAAAATRATRASERLRNAYAIGPWLVGYSSIYAGISGSSNLESREFTP
jgi:glycosyltransferase involved in cell wall biosynthesis